MGLFDRSKQTTTTETNITNISDDSTRVIQDAYNTITSNTISNTLNATDSFKSVVSQPIAILANGSDGAGFNLNKFFENESPIAQTKPKSGISSFLPLIIVGVVIYFGYKFFLKRK